MDCPEDAAAYIHRVGRTARYLSAGRALLLLTPEEKEGMLGLLEGAKVPVQQIKINPKKAQPVGPAVQVGSGRGLRAEGSGVATEGQHEADAACGPAVQVGRGRGESSRVGWGRV